MGKTHIPTSGGGNADFIRELMQYPNRFYYGNVKFVSSVNGTDGTGYGFSPDAPYATINYAVTQVTADNDDVIIVMPGHTETMIAAGTCTISKGCSIVGIGVGRKRPKIKYTTSTAATFAITGSNVVIDNIFFDGVSGALDTVASLVTVQGTDVTFQNCEFELANATYQAVLGILADASTTAPDRLLVKNCFFHGTSDAGTTAAVSWVSGDFMRFQDNIFQGAYSSGVGALQQATTLTTNCIVSGNAINNLTASNTKAMVFTSTSTGQIYNNRMQVLSGSAPITGAAMSWVGANYYGATIGQLGVLI